MRIVSNHRLLFGTALALLSGAALYGCKDFLNKAATPQGTLDQQTLATPAGVEGTLIAAYRDLDCNYTTGAWGCAVSNWVWGSVTSDEAYKGSEATDQPPVDQIEEYHWSTPDAQGYLNDKWGAAYEGVVRANSALRLLHTVQQSSPGAITPTADSGIVGEALFLRAHYHFEAWRMWGNIPYYRENDTDYRKPNETSAQVVTDILKDLDSAVKLLPDKPRGGEVGRATKWTALAYKGRVQMYNKDYTGALATFNQVTASNKYALETSFDHVWTGFPQYENQKETIFAYQASANDGEPGGENANYGERLNFPHSGSPFGCCGFHQPSQNLVNSFQVDANGLPLPLSDANWNADSSAFTAISRPGVAVDPRLDWTVGRDGVPFKDWGAHNRGWIRAPAYGGAYSPKKNIHEQASGAQSTVGWVNTQLNSVNIHIYRYADLLLMKAEAEVEVGSLENARAIVNQIRARAGVMAQGCGWTPSDSIQKLYPQCANDARIAVPINDPSITWATYRVGQYPGPWTDKTYARNAVQLERKLELAMEGQRFFDLKRYGTAEQVLNAYLAVEKTRRPQLASAETFTQKHYLFPIPDLQIQLSKVNGTSTLKQNPQW